ncbi:Tubulin-tyrosine ligase family protein [Trichomonas vaginalis G3]|uniref:Tubulin-tyrosine ligase family protein n=1 Tax=Trichomonas vaginalis (strain ATCC PRA-98 / G3) TaxID=412133 RepID=A2DBP0_TRIV3|nr:positive regulation of cilium movement [Trichomonas vaginalis G3]EAY22243.1 Tubulin-tyrosine ligase family protein [Trichomonas vaginalis G3]KAI5533285.1 positive regulation of cilium movement [Trichomonas vaginalis G3]|eukprot:XP_001583229.1 Tubulin-tyrosine ligase family protein [Trichomonas vaginalis G3]
MGKIRTSFGRVKFKSIKEAIRDAGYTLDETDKQAVLIWHDSLKDLDYFRNLKPWQVVNRIPSANVLCRKVPFARIIQKISQFFPNEYSFFPKSYILPFKNTDFLKSLKKKKYRYIIKPDSGSLGLGIKIINSGGQYSPDGELAVAQRYIPSLLLDKTKFDLRIYVLVASISPLEIYVYRDGLARFCTEKSEGKNTIFSQITNVTLNKSNTTMDHIADVSRLISDIFPRLEAMGINIEQLWKKIDEVIVLSIIAAHRFLVNSEQWQCPRLIYGRCFQIFGFDILLDENANPHVLEINYRPSLDYYRGPERRMKVSMISDAVRIACPYSFVQQAIDSRGWGWNIDEWTVWAMTANISQEAQLEKERAYSNSNFQRVYPVEGPQMSLYDRVMKKADSMPMDFLPGIKLPLNVVRGGEA